MSKEASCESAAMTPRQRFLTALSGGIPDRVPVCPDTSNYLPAQATGKPYWDIYFHQDPPLWQAYLDFVDDHNYEAWNTSCWIARFIKREPAHEMDISFRYDSQQDAMIQHILWRTPRGDMTSERLCFRHDPPSPIERPIKDLARDLPKWLHINQPPDAIVRDDIEKMRDALHRREQAFGIGIAYPGFHGWEALVTGGVATLSYAMMDEPALLDHWHEHDMATYLRCAELAIQVKPDYLFLGGSGTITLASPTLAEKYALPTIRRITAMARAAGIPTLIHSCGKSWDFMRMLHDSTRLDCFNPVELPPHGDARLADAKRAFGPKLALMGNLHTTDVMLRGSPELVRRMSLQAMLDAGLGGGFILSTGDQCPRDTPIANLRAMIETAQRFGRYDPHTGDLPEVRAALAQVVE